MLKMWRGCPVIKLRAKCWMCALQAQALKEACEAQIVREGLVGIGIGSAVLAVAGLAIGLAVGARR